MNTGMKASRFYMWRAVVAMAHADGIVTPQEINYLQEQMKDLSFSEGQMQTLAADLGTAQDIYAMFSQINNPVDMRDFFTYARILCWADGDFAAQEQHILDHLAQGMQNSESRRMLDESRGAVKEIFLDANQWKDQMREKGFINLLRRLAS